jgi:hypothetical protein
MAPVNRHGPWRMARLLAQAMATGQIRRAMRDPPAFVKALVQPYACVCSLRP